MRIGGIASGMDTEQMVKDLMKVERLRVDRYLQQEQKLTWKQEAFNSVNKTIANFILNSRKELGLNQISYNGAIQKSSVDSLAWIKSAVSSNEAAATATARTNSLSGNHSLAVTKLAGNAMMHSSGEVDLDFGITEGAPVSFNLKTEAGEATITVNHGATMQDIVKAINNAKVGDTSLGIQAAYDANSNSIMMVTKKTGEDSFIEISSDADGFAANKLKLSGSKIGVNAEFSFNGVDMVNSSNNFTLYGIDIQLKAVDSTTISVGTNVDGMVEKIKGFVSQYNDLIDNINGQLGQEVYRSYVPLTSEEKEAMSEKDIELWEEKAKSGLLRNNETLTRTLQTIRGNLYESVAFGDGTVHLTDVGISTGGYQDKGKLVINEEKLRAAIMEDPEKVMELFFKIPAEGTADADKLKETGLIQRMYDDLVVGMKETINQSGPGEDSALFRSVQGNMLVDFVAKYSSISILGKDINNLNTRISREEQLLINKEDRYWQQFTAMEKALNSMNQQSSWLMGQLGYSQ